MPQRVMAAKRGVRACRAVRSPLTADTQSAPRPAIQHLDYLLQQQSRAAGAVTQGLGWYWPSPWSAHAGHRKLGRYRRARAKPRPTAGPGSCHGLIWTCTGSISFVTRP